MDGYEIEHFDTSNNAIEKPKIHETETKRESNTSISEVVSKIFKNSGIMLLMTFLLIYLVVFVVFSLYFHRNDGTSTESTISSTFDFAIFGCLFVYATYKYVRLDNTTKENLLKAGSLELAKFYDDPLSLFSTLLFIAVFYFILFLLRLPTQGGYKPISVSFMEAIGWFLAATLIIHNCLKYFFNIDLLNDLLTPPAKTTDISGGAIIAPKPPTPEVFNISNNLYTYDDAQAICRAYDSRLANYDEIESAYQNGAEWCNYGWSADQMAFFPTQKKTWDDLQKSKKHKNSCGRPGVNGGFFKNPNVRFGVNCFGIKPKPNKNDLANLKLRKDRPYPRTEEEKELDEKVQLWKQQLHDNLLVSSFNRDKWSRY
jgi:hypothetical protein